ncbi:MAG: hypothetical protein QY322_00415 [bacterium]|nr:MAG: hypothetical protein QY322_00415 [bacterium]
MKKVNVSTNKMSQFAGKWVVVDPLKNKIIAVGNELSDIDALVTRLATDPREPGTVPAAFKVPYANEGPHYIL